MFGRRIDSGKNYDDSFPRPASWLKRSVTPLPDASVDDSRRGFLKLALGAMAALAVGKTAVNMYTHSAEIDDTVDLVRNRVGIPRTNEKLKPGSLVPDDERSGSEVMMGLVPDYNSLPVIGGFSYGEESLNSGFSQFVSTLESGTKVSILIPKGTTEECRKVVEEKFPGIVFDFLELPMSKGGYNFVSNVVFPTGKKDKDGKNVMISSSLDATMYKQASNIHKVFDADPRNGTAASAIPDEEAGAGLGLFGDEILAKDYPGKFTEHYVPVVTNNGDVRVTRLPSGKVGLIVGKKSLSQTIQALRLQENGRMPANEDQWREFDAIGPESFANWMEKIKNLYVEYFGVEEVILLDEPFLNDFIHRRKGTVQNRAMQGYDFFDSDMIVNTSTDKNGKAVAFCTNYKDTSERGQNESDYTARIAQQLENLNYEIALLPCGSEPTMNYANSVIVTKNDKKIVRLPQYGIPQDKEAERIYSSRGFEVIKVDMSFVKKVLKSIRRKTGSVHCAVSVMS